MKNVILLCIVLGLIACNGSKKIGSDPTVNTSRVERSNSSKGSSKSKSTSSKVERTTKTTSNPSFLDKVEGTTSTPEEPKSNTSVKKKTEDPYAIRCNALISEADKLLGIKYRYAGSSPNHGFDCSGFTSYVFARVDVSIPRTSTDQSRLGSKKKFEDANVGDLVFFGTGQRVTHVALVVGKSNNRLEVVHSTSSKGVIRDNVLGSEYWRSRKLWAVDMRSLN